MFDPIPDKDFAEMVRFILENITGDRTKVIGVGNGHGDTHWLVRRWTGTDWVDG